MKDKPSTPLPWPPGPLRWIIAEDALRDRKGHWFEYISTFARGLKELGDDVVVLAPRDAEPFILSAFSAQPRLPRSIWHRMSDQAGSAVRMLRIPGHALATYRAIRAYVRGRPVPSPQVHELFFVPTVLIHHLLGWYLLLRSTFADRKARVILFFPSLPIRWTDPETTPTGDGSPSFRLMRCILQRLRPQIDAGTVVLGVETAAMLSAASQVFAVKFTLFPHPVAVKAQPSPSRPEANQGLAMACFGPGRHEKGSDHLVAAIERHLDRFPESSTRFVVQWLDDFTTPDGAIARLPASLAAHPRVEIIKRYFTEGEYESYLARTDVLLLPYRTSAYALRVSRVVIEAIVHAIPAIVTAGTTLNDQATRYGASLFCKDGDVESLVDTIVRMEARHRELSALAAERAPGARHHFSVSAFRTLAVSAPS